MMKKLERDFLINSLQQLEIILSVSEELSKAVQHFTQGKLDDPRHHANSKITNSDQWSENDKLLLTAAVSEATFRASELFFTRNEDEIKDLINAKNIFLDQYVPRLTANTDANNRLGTVRVNGQKLSEELMNELRKEAQAETPYEGLFANNTFSFFFTVVSAAVVGTAYVVGNGMKK